MAYGVREHQVSGEAMPSRVRSFHDLQIWQSAIELVRGVYEASMLLPGDERYGLTAQMRRAVVSVPSNIAEGHSRTGRAEYRHGLSVALGSLSEVETHVVIAQQLGWLPDPDVERLVERIAHLRAMMLGIIRKLAR